MAASSVQISPDSTGKFIRTNSRTVGAVLTQEHYFHHAHGEVAAVSSVAANVANVTLQALNQERVGLMIFNDSDVGTLFVKLGTTASLTSYSVAIPPRGSWAMPVPYAGRVDGIWDSSGGTALGGGASSARVTEVTAQ